VATRLSEANPRSIQVVARGLVDRRDEAEVRRSIHELLSSNSDISDSSRGSLLSDFNSSDLDLLNDLVTQLPEEQVAIALAAIALLTRKKWLQFGVYGVAIVGLGLGILAWLHI